MFSHRFIIPTHRAVTHIHPSIYAPLLRSSDFSPHFHCSTTAFYFFFPWREEFPPGSHPSQARWMSRGAPGGPAAGLPRRGRAGCAHPGSDTQKTRAGEQKLAFSPYFIASLAGDAPLPPPPVPPPPVPAPARCRCRCRRRPAPPRAPPPAARRRLTPAVAASAPLRARRRRQVGARRGGCAARPRPCRARRDS